MASTKASSLGIGDKIATGDWYGWVVTEVSKGSAVSADNHAFGTVVLTLEYPEHVEVYLDKSANRIEEDVPSELRRTWFLPGEDIDIERGG